MSMRDKLLISLLIKLINGVRKCNFLILQRKWRMYASSQQYRSPIDTNVMLKQIQTMFDEVVILQEDPDKLNIKLASNYFKVFAVSFSISSTLCRSSAHFYKCINKFHRFSFKTVTQNLLSWKTFTTDI